MRENNKNFSGDYIRAREGCAFFDLSDSLKLVIAGKDHLKFLQGILTNDVLKPSAGQGLYSFMLNRKGRVLCDMRLFREENETVLDIADPAVCERMENLMNGLKLSYRVEIEIKKRALFHICGDSSPQLVSSISGARTQDMELFDHFSDGSIWTMRTDRAGRVGFDLEPASGNKDEILKRFEENGILPANAGVLEVMRVEAGIPMYGKDMDDSTIAPETGLEHAISFDKGCYVGQEIVARVHWRGAVNKSFAGFVFADGTLPSEGSRVFSEHGDEAGVITSSVFSPSAGAVALGYIRRRFKEPGTNVKTEAGERGKVAEFPLA